jgi:hypothetical protein
VDIHNHYVGNNPNGCNISPPLQRRLSSFYRNDNQSYTNNYQLFSFRETTMKFKQSITFDGRNLNDIFRLPCVESIDKGENGKPYIKLYRSCTEGRLIATVGTVLVQFSGGTWQVFGKEAWERATKE